MCNFNTKSLSTDVFFVCVTTSMTFSMSVYVHQKWTEIARVHNEMKEEEKGSRMR